MKAPVLRALLIGITLYALLPLAAEAQPLRYELGRAVEYGAESSVTTSFGSHAPLWLGANRYGLATAKGQQGYLRAYVERRCEMDSDRTWHAGYGADVAIGYGLTRPWQLQQLYIEVECQRSRLTIGQKQQPMMLKNAELSTGSQALGINARPVPAVRYDLNWWNISGHANVVAIKGHLAFGCMTDGLWQEDYVGRDGRYVKWALYHDKSAFLRIGNPERFPLTFTGGMEMATTFGGTAYNPIGYNIEGQTKIHLPHGFKSFLYALRGKGGSDPTDGDQFANSAGNTVGAWLFRLSYCADDWKAHLYYDHFFEDESMLFFQYGWRDGLYGIELELPHCKWVSNIVYEHLRTDYQAGPIYHDTTADISSQISGTDNYYNHNIYQGWQNYGMAIGNALYASPTYREDGSLMFTGNRLRAHHLGLSGTPTPNLHYRVLYSYVKDWGTYALPYADCRHSRSIMAEVTYKIMKQHAASPWTIKAAFAADRGSRLGNNTGLQFTLSYHFQ